MTDAQMTTLAAAFLAAVIAVLFNNSRITDLRNSIDRRFEDMNRHIDDKFNLTDQKLDHIIEMLASHHERISKLEGRS